MTLIRELIDIPEYVDKGSFVLKLSEGVNEPEATLKSYVVTPQLVDCFDNALNFIKGALQGNTSKASYLHGSFGSGKSHFMAVLHLILLGNAQARSIPELAEVIAKHNDWIQGKKFLLVPYHMIGAKDMESSVLGGYADFVRELHPDAPVPGVYRAEGMFRDAQGLRESMGDATFFEKLNEGGSGEAGWGDLAAAWNADRFDAAVEAAPGSEERSQLVGALVKKFFTSFNMQAVQGEAYLSLDKGLSVVSKHAKHLGYDGLILFLDELILWLASHAADLSFVHQESGKVAKLVEAQTADRPTPIVSFVARQRDLRELIGDAVPGAERLNFSDTLGWQEGRFHTITLEDRNLPAIAEKRVLRPHDETARKELDAAFEKSANVRDHVLNILLTSDGDKAMFRQVYPFSPALMTTLIAVSSVLQRERTALKVMMQLLVDQRDTLEVGDLVPVGDLFDVIAHGDEAFNQEMAIHFDNAKRLYHQKLLPVLEQQHGRVEELEKLAVDDPKRVAFRNDDRLVKTLLLAALVPEVESLRGLNAERLAALNHGTIKSPIPGRESQIVVERCRKWAASVGELRIGEGANPTIGLQLTGVDTDGIIEQARKEDNQGNRIRCVKEMLFDELGIASSTELVVMHDFLWKHTRRSCEVLSGNIRTLLDVSLENGNVDWKLVIDWPFDEGGHGPRDDLSKLQTFRDNHAGGAKTLCWVPAFFSDGAMKDLGMLVVLRHILSGERFRQYAEHLSPTDKQAAKSLLDNQKSVLHNRVKSHLEAAYGLREAEGESVDPTRDLELNERFVSLWPGFTPQPPVAADLAKALENFLSQALEHEFPAAPAFETEVKVSTLRKVYEDVRRAAQAQDGRELIEQNRRLLLRHIANPLMLGDMGYDATHFVLGQYWKNHFTKKAHETGGAITVGQLRNWIDDPRPMGLPREAQNLVILIFAEQTSRSFLLHGGPCEPTLTDMRDECELREQRLPEVADWERAIERAGRIFGVTVSPLCNATNVQSLSSQVRQQAESRHEACQAYAQLLQERLGTLGVSGAAPDRIKSASDTLLLINGIKNAGPDDVVDVLSRAQVSTTEQALGDCWARAAELRGVLEGANWEILDAIGHLTDERKRKADRVIEDVKQALQCDEHVAALAPALTSAQSQATRLLTAPSPTPPTPEPEPLPEPVPPPPPKPGRVVVKQASKEHMGLGDAKGVLKDLERDLKQGQVIKVNMSWTIEEEQS